MLHMLWAPPANPMRLHTILSPNRSHLNIHIIPRSHCRSHHIRKVGKCHVRRGERKGRKGIRDYNAKQRNQNGSANKVLGKGNGLVLLFLILGGEEGENHEGNTADKDPRKPGGHYWRRPEKMWAGIPHQVI